MNRHPLKLKRVPAAGHGLTIPAIFPINPLDFSGRFSVKQQPVMSNQKSFGMGIERHIAGLRAPEKIFTEQASAQPTIAD